MVEWRTRLYDRVAEQFGPNWIKKIIIELSEITILWFSAE